MVQQVPLSTNLVRLAERFGIDLKMVADEAVAARLLRDPVAALTPRMQAILLSAHSRARQLGHQHVGVEHVFLAIATDPSAIPTQVMKEMGVDEALATRIVEILTSDGYDRKG